MGQKGDGFLAEMVYILGIEKAFETKRRLEEVHLKGAMASRYESKWHLGAVSNVAIKMNFFMLKCLISKNMINSFFSVKHIHFLKSFIYSSIMNFTVTQVQNSMMRIWKQLYCMY